MLTSTADGPEAEGPLKLYAPSLQQPDHHHYTFSFSADTF